MVRVLFYHKANREVIAECMNEDHIPEVGELVYDEFHNFPTMKIIKRDFIYGKKVPFDGSRKVPNYSLREVVLSLERIQTGEKED